MYPMFGLTADYFAASDMGGFDLEHHLWYAAEVHIGDAIAIRARILERSSKLMHYLMFMVNETRGVLSSIFECVHAHADLSVRRTAPFPAPVAARIDALIADAPRAGLARADLGNDGRNPEISSEVLSISVTHEIGIHRQPDRLALLGMKLAGRQVLVPDDRGKWIGVVGFGGDVLAVFGHGVVRMHEIHREVPDPRPARSGTGLSTRSVFQPMWGIFSPGRAAKRSTRPGSRPRPLCSPSSWLTSNKSCRPRQTPRHGFPSRTASQNASPSPVLCNSAIASANAPTPGSTTFDARRTSSGSELIMAVGPDRLDRLLNAPQIAHAVIDDDDHAVGLADDSRPCSPCSEAALGGGGQIESRIVVPSPGRLSIERAPRCLRQMTWAIVKPTPAWSGLVLKNGSAARL